MQKSNPVSKLIATAMSVALAVGLFPGMAIAADGASAASALHAQASGEVVGISYAPKSEIVFRNLEFDSDGDVDDYTATPFPGRGDTVALTYEGGESSSFTWNGAQFADASGAALRNAFLMRQLVNADGTSWSRGNTKQVRIEYWTGDPDGTSVFDEDVWCSVPARVVDSSSGASSDPGAIANLIAGAATIGLNAEVTGSFSNPYGDFYKVTLPQAGPLTAYVDCRTSGSVAGEYAVDWNLYTADGQRVGGCREGVSSGKHELATIGLPAGTFYLSLEDGSSEGYAVTSYGLSVAFTASGAWETEPNDDPSSADAIELGKTYAGTTREGGEDLFKFVLGESKDIALEVGSDSGASGEVDREFGLRNAGGEGVMSWDPATGSDGDVYGWVSQPGASERLVYRNLAAGTYYAWVRDGEGESVPPYTISVREFAEHVPSADAVANGTWGTCPWELGKDGTLTVFPGAISAHEYYDWDHMGVAVKRIVFKQAGGSKVIAPASGLVMSNISQGVEGIDLSGLDTSQVTNMMSMFSDCSSLKSLDLSGFDTSKVTDMQSMFLGCSSCTSFDLSSFDTSNVTKMTFMFENCSAMKQVKLGAKTRLLPGCYLPLGIWTKEGAKTKLTDAELVDATGKASTAGVWTRAAVSTAGSTMAYKANTVKAKAAKKSFAVKAKKAKKAPVKVSKPVKVTKAKGTVTYSNASKKAKLKKFKVNAKNGTVTVPKGVKKGTYKVLVSASASGNGAYLPGSATATVKIVVK